MKESIKSLVSICIPVFNGANFLEESIQSALDQTYENIEVIIIDDLSSDQSFSIVEIFSRKDKRVKAFKNKKNLGLVGNWNECIKQANGVWIKFLFQDDILYPTCISVMLKNSQNYAFVVGNRDFKIENSAAPFFRDFFENKVKPFEVYSQKKGFIEPELLTKLISEHFLVNILGEPSSFLFKKELCYKYGFFNPFLAHFCDYEFWIRICSHEGVIYIPEVLSAFRVHGSSTSTENFSKNFTITSILDCLLISFLVTYHSNYWSIKGKINSKKAFDYYLKESSNVFDVHFLKKLRKILTAYPLLLVLFFRIKFLKKINQLFN